jgi:hypothetical protein
VEDYDMGKCNCRYQQVQWEESSQGTKSRIATVNISEDSGKLLFISPIKINLYGGNKSILTINKYLHRL